MIRPEEAEMPAVKPVASMMAARLPVSVMPLVLMRTLSR